MMNNRILISIILVVAVSLLCGFNEKANWATRSSILDNDLQMVDKNHFVYGRDKDESYEIWNLIYAKGHFRKTLDLQIPGSFERMEFVTIPMLSFSIIDKYLVGYGPLRDDFGWRECFECRSLKDGKKIWGTTIEEYERYKKPETKPFAVENGYMFLVTTKNKKDDYIYREAGKSLECRLLSTGKKIWSQPIDEIDSKFQFSWESRLVLFEDKIILVREVDNTGDVLIYRKKDGVLINQIKLPILSNSKRILPVIQNKYLVVSQSGDYALEQSVSYVNGKKEKFSEGAKGSNIHFINLQTGTLVKTMKFLDVIYALPFNTMYKGGEYYFSSYRKNGGTIIIVNSDFNQYKMIKTDSPLMSLWDYKGRILVGGYHGVGELEENKVSYFIFKRRDPNKIDFDKQLESNYSYLIEDKLLWQNGAVLSSYDINTCKTIDYQGDFVGYDTLSKTLVTKEKKSFAFVFVYCSRFVFKGYSF